MPIIYACLIASLIFVDVMWPKKTFNGGLSDVWLHMPSRDRLGSQHELVNGTTFSLEEEQDRSIFEGISQFQK